MGLSSILDRKSTTAPPTPNTPTPYHLKSKSGPNPGKPTSTLKNKLRKKKNRHVPHSITADFADWLQDYRSIQKQNLCKPCSPSAVKIFSFSNPLQELRDTPIITVPKSAWRTSTKFWQPTLLPQLPDSLLGI